MATNKHAFIERKPALLVMENLPNSEWRLLFALSRWGGLRVGSEARRLRWSDIDWARKRFTVHATKTERYSGHETRTVPIFPELAELLSERHEDAEDGDELVLPMLVGRTDQSLRKTLLRAIKLAGEKPWPRLWHNMRSTRQTELEDHFPTHVTCSWLGNSQATARKHYLQMREDHFERAVQNPAQNVSAEQCTDKWQNISAEEKSLRKQQSAVECDSPQDHRAVGEGFEPPVPCGTPVFKTGAFDHSATRPTQK